MKRYVDELVKRIDELIKIYEQYSWKDEERFFAVFFKENTIMFNLSDGEEVIDEIYLTFEEKEYAFYQAVCLRTFAILLGNVMVYRDEVQESVIMYHNEIRKPDLAVVSCDNRLTFLLDQLVDRQEEEYINGSKTIKLACDSVKRYIPNSNVIDMFDERIAITKELVRRYQ